MARNANDCLQAARQQLRTARDGLSDAINHPERKERGLRVAVEFGRAVGEALRLLKSRVAGYDEWWSHVTQTYLSNPVCGYLYGIRNGIFHEGLIPVSQSVHLESAEIEGDAIRFDGQDAIAPPPGAKEFVIGDPQGNDGWVVGNGQFVTHPMRLPKSGSTFHFDDAPAEFRYRPAHESVAFWLDRLEDVVVSAETTFGTSR